MADGSDTNVLGLTAKIVSAHIGNNQVAADALPELIQSVHRSLATAGTVATAEPAPTPAVPIRKLVFPDHIVCLEDGKKLKMLKRHLQASYGMMPEQYRKKRGLPADYPHGGTELRQPSFKPREAERPRPKAGKLSSGTGKSDREKQEAGPAAGSASGGTGPGTTRTRVQRLSSGLLFMSALPSNNQSVHFLIRVG